MVCMYILMYINKYKGVCVSSFFKDNTRFRNMEFLKAKIPKSDQKFMQIIILYRMRVKGGKKEKITG